MQIILDSFNLSTAERRLRLGKLQLGLDTPPRVALGLEDEPPPPPPAGESADPFPFDEPNT